MRHIFPHPHHTTQAAPAAEAAAAAPAGTAALPPQPADTTPLSRELTPAAAPPPPAVPHYDPAAAATAAAAADALREKDAELQALRTRLAALEDVAGGAAAEAAAAEAAQEKIAALQARVTDESQAAARERQAARDAEARAVEAAAEVRRLGCEAERLQLDAAAQARRLDAQAAARCREELHLWAERGAVELSEADARAALARLEADRRLLALVRAEGAAAAERVRAAAARHDEEFLESQAEVRGLERAVEAARDEARRHEKAAALARAQLEDHRVLQDKGADAAALERQRRREEAERTSAERDDARERAAAAEREAARLRRAAEEQRARAEEAAAERAAALAALAEERDDRLRTLGQMREQLRGHERARAELTQRVPDFEREKGVLEERVRALEATRRQQDEEVRTLRREREEAEAKVGEVRQLFREKQKGDEVEVLRLLRNDRAWRAERAEMEQELKRLGDECRRRTTDVIATQREFAHLAKRAGKAQRKRAEMKQEAIEMANRVKALAADGAHARSVMLDEVEEAKGMHRAAAHTLDSQAAHERGAWQAAAVAQEAELVRCRAELADKSATVDTLSREVEELHALRRYSVGLTATPRSASRGGGGGGGDGGGKASKKMKKKRGPSQPPDAVTPAGVGVGGVSGVSEVAAAAEVSEADIDRLISGRNLRGILQPLAEESGSAGRGGGGSNAHGVVSSLTKGLAAAAAAAAAASAAAAGGTASSVDQTPLSVTPVHLRAADRSSHLSLPTTSVSAPLYNAPAAGATQGAVDRTVCT